MDTPHPPKKPQKSNKKYQNILVPTNSCAFRTSCQKGNEAGGQRRRIKIKVMIFLENLFQPQKI